ncbi:GGDEF domain-containing protein [Streptomyces syringium]|uniref:GGDEF domain-containing protein n=1 Tax=Streptomyces syringium TaxID=76729 RepID=UPI00366769AB
MSQALSAVAVAAPLVAGWSVHSLWFRRRIERARRDPLTGLLTRELFESRARKLAHGGAVAVVVIDLDRFKQLNDTHGHAAGDAMLQATGRRLIESVRRPGAVARLGGDEFAVVFRCTAPSDMDWVLFDLHEALCAPVDFEGRSVRVGASLGAIWGDARGGVDLSALMRRADEAMYAAKPTGGWCIADGLAPVMTTTNGRRTGRPGAAFPAGGAR